jgi:hypothetical protein
MQMGQRVAFSHTGFSANMGPLVFISVGSGPRNLGSSLPQKWLKGSRGQDGEVERRSIRPGARFR